MSDENKTIVFVSCVKTKSAGSAWAKELFWSSALFPGSYQFAESMGPNRILLLTTQYGLVLPDEVIRDCDRAPNTMTSKAWNLWAERVLRRLASFANPRTDRFIFLTGRKYSDPLVPHLRNVVTPLQGLRRGERLAFLAKQLRR